MNTLPESFLSSYPRLASAVGIPGSEQGPVCEMVSVSSISITIPLAAERSLYGAMNRTTVVLQGEICMASGDGPAGGAELTNDELMALPGATEFLSALNTSLLNKWVATLAPVTLVNPS